MYSSFIRIWFLFSTLSSGEQHCESDGDYLLFNCEHSASAIREVQQSNIQQYSVRYNMQGYNAVKFSSVHVTCYLIL